MGWFEKFTLCCVVTVIASLSILLVGSVQLFHRLEDVVNRDNSELLQKIEAVRTASELHSGMVNNGGGPLLAMIIRSSKQNYALRRTIRHTWAREDHRAVHRFVLHSEHIRHKADDEDGLAGWLTSLQHRGTVATNARYTLFVNDSVFVNTRLLLKGIERVLPKERFILCTPTVANVPGQQNVSCDASHPILVSMDIVRGTARQPVVHDGGRLYLNRRETEALVRHQLDDELGLTYFFTAPLHRLSLKVPLTLLIEQLWMSSGGNNTPVEY